MLTVYQGAIEWSAAETLAQLGLGQDATIEQVTARVLGRGLVVARPIEVRGGTIIVRMPAEQPRPSREITLELRIAELERRVSELQQARQDEAGRADRAEARAVKLTRVLDEQLGHGWRAAS